MPGPGAWESRLAVSGGLALVPLRLTDGKESGCYFLSLSRASLAALLTAAPLLGVAAAHRLALCSDGRGRGAGSAPAGCGREGRRLGRAERGGPPSGRRGESQSPRGPLAALAHLSLGPRSGEAGESPASLLGRGARSRGSRNSRPGVCFPSQNYNAPPEAIVFLLRRVVDDAAERPPGRVPWRDGEGVGRRGGLPRGVCPPAAGLSRASLGKSTWVGASKRVGIKYL